MTTIGFTGTRNGLCQGQKEQIIKILDQYATVTVLHGDCVGADTEFHKICVEYRTMHPARIIRIGIYPPNNDRLRGFNRGDFTQEPAEYLKRNRAIVQAADFIIACPPEDQHRSGTWYTINYAKRSGKMVVILV
jgi:predicted Rossmann fold nucleotide-binding protein DprA/Smf involved in DNA uptake